jgi:hypothetical protein
VTGTKGDTASDVCTIGELVALAAVEFKWSRREAWQRVKEVAETRGLPELMYLVQPVKGQQALHYRATNNIADADRRQVVRLAALRLLREEFPHQIGSKRGPKPKYDWAEAREALEKHWAIRGRQSDRQAEDEDSVKSFFASSESGDEPSESMIREKVKGWREANRGR